MLVSFRAAVAAARKHRNLYFASLLGEERILKTLGPASSLWQGWIYTAPVTVWTFLAQCLSPDHSCREAVAQLQSWLTAQGSRPCSPETGAYCTARAQLPEDACQQLVRDTGAHLDAQAPEDWLWRKRRVRIVDGSTITMADTPANQAEYPQLKEQKPGCGFPIARIVVVLSLAVGTVLEAAIGRYEGKLTGENSMFRMLHDVLDAGDVVLVDRYFSGWFDITLLQQRGVDVVVRKHQLRVTDFRRGTRLGHDDQLVRWHKPARPAWLSPAEYTVLPEVLVLREVRVRVTQRGFRTKSLVVVTTLLDPFTYEASEIAELYRRRWHAELHLRSLKTVLQMNHLRCKAPARVRNEFRMHLLAYNLIRQAMAAAALQSGAEPWQISFKGALQTLNSYMPMLCSRVSVEDWCDALLRAIATHHVGNRPDRYEPRLVKRRSKPYKHLREPRANYKRRAA